MVTHSRNGAVGGEWHQSRQFALHHEIGVAVSWAIPCDEGTPLEMEALDAVDVEEVTTQRNVSK